MTRLTNLIVAVLAVWVVVGKTEALIVGAIMIVPWYFWSCVGVKTRNKIMIGSWDPPSSPEIYTKISLDGSKILEWMEKQRKITGKHITLTHVVGKAIGLSIKLCPCINGRILWDRFVPHKSIDLSFLVSLKGGRNLAKKKVCNIDMKSVEQICDEIHAGADDLEKGKDKNFQKAMGPVSFLPTWLVRPILYWTGFLTGVLGVTVPALGLEPFPFGCCVVTSVGMLGVEEAYAPFTPWCRVPLLVLVGALHDGAVAVDGELKIRKKLKLMCTIDHRYMDGAQGAAMNKRIREIFADPDTYLV